MFWVSCVCTKPITWTYRAIFFTLMHYFIYTAIRRGYLITAPTDIFQTNFGRILSRDIETVATFIDYVNTTQ
jgi:hypothetical protein